MALPNIFTQTVSEDTIGRINQLRPTTKGNWGKMDVSQMLAHCNVMYEMVYDNKHSKPGFFMKFILKNFIKKVVTSETPYKRNAQTAPAFIIKDKRDFDRERSRLIDYIRRTKDLGESTFHNKASLNFGVLNKTEWNNMFYKHLDHHLTQFGV